MRNPELQFLNISVRENEVQRYSFPSDFVRSHCCYLHRNQIRIDESDDVLIHSTNVYSSNKYHDLHFDKGLDKTRTTGQYGNWSALYFAFNSNSGFDGENLSFKTEKIEKIQGMFQTKLSCDLETCYKNSYTDFFEIFEICTLATCVILSVDFLTKVSF